MKQRITTAIIALAVLGGLLFYMPPIVVRVFIAVLLLAGAWEWSGFLGKGSVATRLAYVTLIGVLIVAMATLLAPHTTTVLLASLSWWAIALLWTFFFPTPIPMMVRWLVGALVLVPLYAALMLLYAADPMILLFALLIVWVADSGAYVAGKTLGRVKLAPQISPGKTWEGVIGGLVAVVLLIGLRSFKVETNFAVLVPFCLGVAALSVVGDLTVSMFKRNAGMKDSGTMFPGHGGVLDRIDSVAAAAPLFALGLSWAGVQ
jgi:phosphatidate cytidylyltransferase